METDAELTQHDIKPLVFIIETFNARKNLNPVFLNLVISKFSQICEKLTITQIISLYQSISKIIKEQINNYEILKEKIFTKVESFSKIDKISGVPN